MLKLTHLCMHDDADCRHAKPAGGCFFRGKEEIFKKKVPEADAASSD